MDERRYEVKFKYWDSLSNWKERTQSCSLYASTRDEAINRCMKLYGLGKDCDYEIISVVEC